MFKYISEIMSKFNDKQRITSQSGKLTHPRKAMGWALNPTTIAKSNT